jgi:hypothetical protein
MRRTGRALGVFAVAALLLAISPGSAQASDAVCGDVPPETTEVLSDTTVTNLIVPDPEHGPSGPRFSGLCSLENVTVTGNVVIQIGASLTALNVVVNGNVVSSNQPERIELESMSVFGNLQISGACFPSIRNSTIAQNLLVEGARCAGGDLAVEVLGNAVGGDLQVVKTFLGFTFGQELDILVHENDVGGNLQVIDTHGAVKVSDNTVTGNLQCFDNTDEASDPPRPLISVGNSAASFAGNCTG